MAEIDPFVASLYSKVRKLLAWFPIQPGSIGTGTNNTVLATDGSGVPGWRSIVNAMVSASAAIAYSKLNLTGSIVLGDLASSLYSTGTWTPVLAGDSTAGSHTYNAGATAGQYTRIGNICVAWFQVILTAKDAAMAGNVYVSLPLTMAASSILGIGSIAAFSNINFAAGYTQLHAHVGQATTRAVLYTGGDNVATAAVVAADIANDTAIRAVVIYPV